MKIEYPSGWIDERLCNHYLTGTTISYFIDGDPRQSHKLVRTYCTMCGKTLTEERFVTHQSFLR